jgi:hypothetical protein
MRGVLEVEDDPALAVVVSAFGMRGLGDLDVVLEDIELVRPTGQVAHGVGVAERTGAEGAERHARDVHARALPALPEPVELAGEERLVGAQFHLVDGGGRRRAFGGELVEAREHRLREHARPGWAHGVDDDAVAMERFGVRQDVVAGTPAERMASRPPTCTASISPAALRMK